MICEACRKEQPTSNGKFCAFCGRRLENKQNSTAGKNPAGGQTIVYTRKEKRSSEPVFVPAPQNGIDVAAGITAVQSGENSAQTYLNEPVQNPPKPVLSSDLQSELKLEIDKQIQNQNDTATGLNTAQPQINEPQTVLNDVKANEDLRKEEKREAGIQIQKILSASIEEEAPRPRRVPETPAEEVKQTLNTHVSGQKRFNNVNKAPKKAGEQTLFINLREKEDYENLSNIKGENLSELNLEESTSFLPPEQESEKKNAGKNKEKRASKGTRFVLALILIFIFAFGGLSFLFVGMRNGRSKAVYDFTAVVQKENYKKLAANTDFKGVQLNEANAEKIFEYFADESRVKALEKQLLSEDNSGAHSAFSLQKRRLFFIVDSYYVQVEGVAFFVVGLTDDMQLLLDGEEQMGQNIEGGFLFKGFIPGEYDYAVYLKDAQGYPEEDLDEEGRYVISQGKLQLFDPVNPALIELEAAQPPAPPEPVVVTVANCISDDADIYINNELSPHKPVGGVLTLSDPPQGALIKIIVDMGTYTREASLTYTGENSALSFDNYVGEAPEAPADPNKPDPVAEPEAFARALSFEEIDVILAEFYTSYLACVNAQSMNGIVRSTANMNAVLEKRLTLPGNQSNNFLFASVQPAKESFTATVLDGRPCAYLNAEFNYQYRPRNTENEYQSGANKSSVQLIYIDGAWVVNNMAAVADDKFNTAQYANFE